MPIRRSFVQGAFVGGAFSFLGLGLGALVVALSSAQAPNRDVGKGAAAPQASQAARAVTRTATPVRTENVYRMACRDCVNLVVTEPKSAYPLGPNLLMLSVDKLGGGQVLVHVGQESHLLHIGQYADLTFEAGCRLALARSVKGRADFMFACDQDDAAPVTIASVAN